MSRPAVRSADVSDTGDHNAPARARGRPYDLITQFNGLRMVPTFRNNRRRGRARESATRRRHEVPSWGAESRGGGGWGQTAS